MGQIRAQFYQYFPPFLPVCVCCRQSAKALRPLPPAIAGAGGMYTTGPPMNFCASLKGFFGAAERKMAAAILAMLSSKRTKPTIHIALMLLKKMPNSFLFQSQPSNSFLADVCRFTKKRQVRDNSAVSDVEKHITFRKFQGLERMKILFLKKKTFLYTHTRFANSNLGICICLQSTFCMHNVLHRNSST